MVKKVGRIGLSACWLIWASALSAGAADLGLSLDDCYRAAQKQSEILAGQTEQINQAEARYGQALAAVLPSIALQGSYLYEQERNGPASSQTVARLAAGQPLFRGFREFAALRQSQQLITAEKEAWQWAGLQLYRDVAEAYYTVQSLETERAHLGIQLRLYDQRIKDLNDRVRIGRSRDSEVLSVQSAQAALQAQDQEQLGLISVARDLLAFLTGLPRDSALQTPPIFDLSLDPLESYLGKMGNRPDVAAARAQAEADREAVGIAGGGHWPAVDASANYYIYGSGMPRENTWDAQLALTLPLFMGGAVVSQTSEARARLRQSESALQRMSRLAEQEIRSQYAVLKAELAQRAAWEKAAGLAHQNYLAVLRDYNLGLATNLEVLTALADDQDTQRSLDRSGFAVWIAYSRFQAAVATAPVQKVGGGTHP